MLNRVSSTFMFLLWHDDGEAAAVVIVGVEFEITTHADDMAPGKRQAETVTEVVDLDKWPE